MRRRPVSAVTCLLVLAALIVARPAFATCESPLPWNIDAGSLEPDLLDLLQRSATFRRQCARIADTRVLRVTLRVVAAIEGGGRAQTRISRYEMGALRAEVSVLFGEDYQELLAHEFEHILEQVDGVSLRDEVAAGRAWITASGAFETRRAAKAGIRVREECDATATEPAHVDSRKAPVVSLRWAY